MGEKGGKGFSIPKSSLKSTPTNYASAKGKDDSSTKLKKGRKAKFDSESPSQVKFSFPSNYDGKFDAANAKADWSTGGKGGSMTKGKKDSVKKQEPLQLRKQDVPNNAQCLMDCEAAQILQAIQDHMVALSKDPTFKIHESFSSGLQYAKAGAPYTNPQSVRRVLDVCDNQSLAKINSNIRNLIPYGVSAGEISVIANVCPETVEEVFALVPSLKAQRSKLREPLNHALTELSKLKMSA